MAKVLVIDDEEVLLRTLNLVLGAAGHDVRTAVQGEEGEAEMLSWVPDIVITDVAMPGKSGTALIAAARARGLKTKFIAISGDRESLIKAKAAGADDAVEKPFGSGLFLEAVERVLNAG